jgi:hypothetical protein
VGKHKAKRLVGISTRGLVNNIKMDLQKGWEGLRWIQANRDRSGWREFVNTEVDCIAFSPFSHTNMLQVFS